MLKSGRPSHLYVNWRTATEDVFLTDRLSDMVLDYLDASGIFADTLYGVPEGATKLAVLAQFKWARRSKDYGVGSHVLAMGRGNPKEHGNPKDRYFLGQPKGSTLVIEDVTTTARSAVNAAKRVEDGGVPVLGMLSLFNRMNVDAEGRSADDACRQASLPFAWIGSADKLLPRAYAAMRPSDEIAERIEEEYRQFGVRPISLR